METNVENKQSSRNDVNYVLPAVFQSDKQWAVAQEKGTVYLNTLSCTRKEAIKKFMGCMDKKLKWEYFKNKRTYPDKYRIHLSPTA